MTKIQDNGSRYFGFHKSVIRLVFPLFVEVESFKNLKTSKL